MIILFGIVLKIPVGFGIWLVWWASRSYDEEAEGLPPAAEDHGFRRWRRQPKGPRGPRRGPHGGGARALPECPPGHRRSRVTGPLPLTRAPAHAQRGSHRVRD